MKIIIINSGRKFTGEAAHSLDLAEQLVRHGHEVRLVLRGDGKVIERARERGIAVAASLDFAKGITPRSTANDLLAFRRLILAERPDVIHCHRGNDHGLAVAAVTGCRCAPTIVRTRHRGLPVKNSISNRWLFVRATAGVLAVSENAAASFGAMRPLIADKLSVVLSSVDTENFHQGRRSEQWRAAHGVAVDEPLIGLVARLQRVKGQDPFLRAAALVHKEFLKARFLVAGAGSDQKMSQMKKLIKELGIEDRVFFEAWLPDVHTVVASLDVGVLASLGSEASSRVTYEYMASGVPVVATSVGCIPEIVKHGETGYVVPPANPAAIADAVKNLLRNPDMAREMQQKANIRIHEFHNRGRWVADILAAYEKAIAHKKSHRGLKTAMLDYIALAK